MTMTPTEIERARRHADELLMRHDVEDAIAATLRSWWWAVYGDACYDEELGGEVPDEVVAEVLAEAVCLRLQERRAR